MDVSYEVHDGAAWITLQRPEALNALTVDVVEALDSFLDRASDDDEVRSLVITGSGRGFCAGADLKHVFTMGAEQQREAVLTFVSRVNEVFSRLAGFAKPVIAAVNGIAVAGGLELILCCDIVVAADTAKIGDAHANYGLLPGAGSSARLPRAVPVSWAKYLLFTGRSVTALEAAEMGLVTFVCPAEQLSERVLSIVRDISQRSPLSLRLVKELANRSYDEPVQDRLACEQRALSDYARSADMAEGLAAFNAKRPPVFVGR